MEKQYKAIERARCETCGWKGLTEEVVQHVSPNGSDPFNSCPVCDATHSVEFFEDFVPSVEERQQRRQTPKNYGSW